MDTSTQWIVTADARRAALFACRPAHDGRWRVEQLASLENAWEASHERGRPSALGSGPAANARQHFASRGHEQEEERARFARDVRAWLDRAMAERGIEGPVHVFSPPAFLGVLRERFSDTERVLISAGELIRLYPSALAEHPAVRHVLAPGAA